MANNFYAINAQYGITLTNSNNKPTQAAISTITALTNLYALEASKLEQRLFLAYVMFGFMALGAGALLLALLYLAIYPVVYSLLDTQAADEESPLEDQQVGDWQHSPAIFRYG